MLAIIIPYYKLAYFEATLQSLADQTDKRFKLYIGNDHSPEDPRPLLDTYKGQFNYVYHEFESNMGRVSLAKQWDRCIALAAHKEWIMLLGDDDVLAPNVVSQFYEHLNLFKTQCNVVRFASITLFESTKTQSDIYKHPVLESSYDFYCRRLAHQTRSSLSEYVFKDEAYKQFGFYDYPLASHSDDRAWFDFSDGKPIYTINDAIVYVRMSDLNISGRTDNTDEKLKAQLLFFDYLLGNRLKYFSNNQQKSILLKYEKLIFYNKRLSITRCFKLIFLYLLKLDFKSLFRLSKRMLKVNNKNKSHPKEAKKFF